LFDSISTFLAAIFVLMFRTELTITPAARQLARTARVLTLGSCFADSIGSRLQANKVDASVNPFGTVFHPLAMALLLRAAAGESVDWQQHVVEARGRWQSYDLHGSLGADSPVELLQNIQGLVQRTADFVRQADLVVLTLGTAWAYRLRETGELVSNCHKMPAELFEKELLTPDDIINSLAEVHALLRRMNPRIQIVLTVSPVRHIKDTLPLNAVSKSVLRVATHYLSDLLPDVSYFPAYELLTDDLRDYRFYAADMLHPSEVAEDYIWEKFARTYFDVDFGRFRKEWAAVQQSLGHRPLHAGAPEHRQFLLNTLEHLQRLAGQQVDVSAEQQDLEQRLAALPEPKPLVLPEPEFEDDGEERIDIGTTDESSPATPEIRPAERPIKMANTAEAAPARAERLSPEEFRSQRNNRDRRGRDNRHPRPEHGQPVETGVPAGTPLLPTPDSLPEINPVATPELASAAIMPPAVSAAAPLPEAEAEGLESGGKKKKRRSRGGAKRTARKHAARLAAEVQLSAEPTPEAAAPSVGTDTAPAAPIAATSDAPAAPAVPAIPAAPALATPPAAAAPAPFPAPPRPIKPARPVTGAQFMALPAYPAPAPAASAEQPNTTPGQPEPMAEAPAARPEASRPTGKKSSVITKSTPVKRGRRGAPVANAPSNAPTVPTAATLEAANSVPPVVVEPAAALPVPPPSPVSAAPAPLPAAPKPAPAVSGLLAALSKSARSRPAKAKAQPAKPAPTTTAPAAAAIPAKPVTSLPVASGQAAQPAKAEPKAAPKPAKKSPKKLALYAAPQAQPVASPAPEPASAPALVASPAPVATPPAVPAEESMTAVPAPKPKRQPTRKAAAAPAAKADAPAPAASTPAAAPVTKRPSRPAAKPKPAPAAAPAPETPPPVAKPKKAAPAKPKTPKAATKKA
jgi:hypothetical protein